MGASAERVGDGAGIDLAGLADQARGGSVRALSRLISLVEERSAAVPQLMSLLAAHQGHAHVVGLTGPPGVGKSSSVSALVTAYRDQGKRIAVLAVDPSSPFSSGALLGDRIRMHDHATDPRVYIRSMASRGHLGGLSWTTPPVLRVLSAAGFDVILVETVGVGQAEVDIATLADTTLVFLAPGTGDEVQAAKAGILEVADILVVNKADLDNAERLVRELRRMISLGERHAYTRNGWHVPVLKSVATTGDGVDGVVAAIAKHEQWLHASGELDGRRMRRAALEISAIALTTLRRRIDELSKGTALVEVARRVVTGELDTYSAAAELVAGVSS